MKNLDKHEWSITTQESKAIRELESRGLVVTIKRRSITNDKFTIERDGFSWEIDVPVGSTTIKYSKYFEMVEKTFEMAKIFQ